MKKKWFDAISYRTSKRAYIEKSVSHEDKNDIKKLIEWVNTQSGLDIQWIDNCESLFKGFFVSYGLISGVHTCIAIVGNKNIINYKTQAGYYGEMLVLEATSRGLGTCWIGGTYKKEECKKYIRMNEDDELLCVIAIGETVETSSWKEKVIAKINRHRKRVDELVKQVDVQVMPNWFMQGMYAVEKAPSALNKLPVVYSYEKGVVIAEKTTSKLGLEDIDLGISMLHFELGANYEEKYGEWKYENGKNIFYLDV